jgi:hypothetical protein
MRRITAPALPWLLNHHRLNHHRPPSKSKTKSQRVHASRFEAEFGPAPRTCAAAAALVTPVRRRTVLATTCRPAKANLSPQHTWVLSTGQVHRKSSSRHCTCASHRTPGTHHQPPYPTLVTPHSRRTNPSQTALDFGPLALSRFKSGPACSWHRRGSLTPNCTSGLAPPSQPTLHTHLHRRGSSRTLDSPLAPSWIFDTELHIRPSASKSTHPPHASAPSWLFENPRLATASNHIALAPKTCHSQSEPIRASSPRSPHTWCLIPTLLNPAGHGWSCFTSSATCRHTTPPPPPHHQRQNCRTKTVAPTHMRARNTTTTSLPWFVFTLATEGGQYFRYNFRVNCHHKQPQEANGRSSACNASQLPHLGLFSPAVAQNGLSHLAQQCPPCQQA